MERETLIQEYLAVSRKQSGQLSLGLILGSLVFIIPMILIAVNSWWYPFEGDASVGIRWFVVASAAMVLMYIAIIIDRLYRNF